jgi:hypothetical protein
MMKPRKPLRVGDGTGELAREVAGLLTLDGKALQQRWRALFGNSPSARLSRNFMIRALAYKFQEKALAGLKSSTRRMLDRVAESGAEAALQGVQKRPATAGTVLIRQWRGRIHRVTVQESDVVYRGRRYESLSEVARLITGTRWSGPRFFGLKARAKETVNG